MPGILYMPIGGRMLPPITYPKVHDGRWVEQPVQWVKLTGVSTETMSIYMDNGLSRLMPLTTMEPLRQLAAIGACSTGERK